MTLLTQRGKLRQWEFEHLGGKAAVLHLDHLGRQAGCSCISACGWSLFSLRAFVYYNDNVLCDLEVG